MKLNYGLLLRLVITLAILSILLTMLDVGLLVRSLEQMNPIMFLIALGLMPVMILTKCYRWYSMVNQSETVEFRYAVSSLLVGSTLGLMTPARTGELARIAYLPVKNKSRFLGLVIFDKVLDLLSFIILAIAGSMIVVGTDMTAVLLAILLVVSLALLSIRRVSRFCLKSARLSKIIRLKSLAEVMVTLDAGKVAFYQLLAIVAALVTTAQCFIILSSFQSVEFSTAFFTFPLIILTTAFPVTIGGLGVREGAAVLLLAQFGIPGATAFNTAFIAYLINSVIPSVIGVLVIFSVKLERKKPEKVLSTELDRGESGEEVV